MNKLSLLATATSALLFSSCASDLTVERVSMRQSGATSDTADRLHQSINAHRRTIGKPALRRHSGLDRLAYQHSRFMAANRGKFTLGSENISHYGFEDRALMAKRAYRMQSVAENVAGGKIEGDIPAALLSSWTTSTKHNYNLSQDWDATGLGVHVADDGMVYATQLFAMENRSHSALTDRLTSF
jgi:uncharacterized protein YkwD